MSADHPSVAEPGAAPLEERYAQVRALIEQGRMQQAGTCAAPCCGSVPTTPSRTH